MQGLRPRDRAAIAREMPEVLDGRDLRCGVNDDRNPMRMRNLHDLTDWQGTIRMRPIRHHQHGRDGSIKDPHEFFLGGAHPAQ